MTRLIPDRAHPVSRGFACGKGLHFHEVSQDPTRIVTPQRRDAGALREVSWDTAMSEAGGRLRRIIEAHGRHAVAFYFGNPMAFSSVGAFSMLDFNRRLDSRNVYGSGSQDCNNKFAGAALMHGSLAIHPIPDLEHCDLTVMFGTNPAISMSSFVHLPEGSKVFDRIRSRGGKVVWVDPRRTESVKAADDHLAIRPGTDVWLLLALLHQVRGSAPSDERVTGFDRVAALAAGYPPSRVAELTGLDEAAIVGLSDQIRTRRTALHMSLGVNQGPFGTLSYVLLQALAFATGNYDRRGGSIFNPFGSWLGRGLRRFGIDRGGHVSRIGGHRSTFNALPGAILADEILTPGEGQIRGLICIAGNPASSVPGGERLRTALASLDTLVTIDMFENETGRFADYVLPTPTWLERADVATSTVALQASPLLQTSGAVVPPPPGVRSERWIFEQLALAMGLRGRLQPKLTSLLARIAGRSPPIPDRAGVPVPAPKPGTYLGRGPVHSDHRVRFWGPELDVAASRLEEVADELCRGDGLVLIGRRRRNAHNSWLTGSRQGAHEEPVAYLSPDELERQGLAEGDRMALRVGERSLELPVAADPGLASGTVSVTHGTIGGSVNDLIDASAGRIDPMSGQLWMSAVPVRLEQCRDDEARGVLRGETSCTSSSQEHPQESEKPSPARSTAPTSS